MLMQKFLIMLLEKGMGAIIKNSNKEGPTLGIIIAAAILTIGTLLMDSYTKGVKKTVEPTVIVNSLEYQLLQSKLQNCLTEKEFIVKMQQVRDQLTVEAVEVVKPVPVSPKEPSAVTNTQAPPK